MGINIDLYKVNYNEFVNKLMENQKINDKDLLEKTILEFGNKVRDELVILHNEYYEDGICTWNMFNMIAEVFGLDDDEFVSDVYYELKKGLISYKEIDKAYENIGLEPKGEKE